MGFNSGFKGLILVRHKPVSGSEIRKARHYTLPCDTSFRHLPHCADTRIMTLLHVPPLAVTQQKLKKWNMTSFYCRIICREFDRRPEVCRPTNGGRTGHSVVGQGAEKSDLGFLFSKACFLRDYHFVPNMLFFFPKFDVGQSVHHHTIQINQPTRCTCFTSLLLEGLYVAQHVSGVSTPIIRSLQLH